MRKRVLSAEQKLEAREYQIAYRAKNAESLKAKKAAYYAANRVHFRAQHLEYRQRNIDAVRLYDRQRRGSGPGREQKLAQDRAYREKNKEAFKAKRAPYFAARKPAKRAYDIAYREKHKDRLQAKQQSYYLNNKPIFYAIVRKRTAQKLMASPKWADQALIQDAFRLAELKTKETGYSWHVDHIVPLRSKIVCGLHTHMNLQVIPGAENLAKGNRYWPDMP